MLNLPQDLTYWNANAPAANFPQLASDISVDVAIIGGGIVGITTARLLKDAGLTVTVKIGRASCRERVVSVRVDLGGRRIIKQKTTIKKMKIDIIKKKQ